MTGTRKLFSACNTQIPLKCVGTKSGRKALENASGFKQGALIFSVIASYRISLMVRVMFTVCS